jgi:hypothetical protein
MTPYEYRFLLHERLEHLRAEANRDRLAALATAGGSDRARGPVAGLPSLAGRLLGRVRAPRSSRLAASPTHSR